MVILDATHAVLVFGKQAASRFQLFGVRRLYELTWRLKGGGMWPSGDSLVLF